MFTVALVGSDGAGKTTIAKTLEESFPLIFKYMYMGISPISSSHALPTTRLAGYLRVRAVRKTIKDSDKHHPEKISMHDLHYRSIERGSIWVIVRTLNRMVDAVYRHIVSLFYQLRGYIVIYDRHLLFEMAPRDIDSKKHKRLTLRYIEYWLYSRLFPKPTLILFLDASPDVLYSRKKEANLEYLEQRRATILKQGEMMTNFIQIDAAQSFDAVLADVTHHIQKFKSKSSQKTIRPDVN